MKKSRFILLMLGIILGMIMPIHKAEAQLSQFQPLFILNFAKNIDWKSTDMDSDIIITIYGDHELFTSAQTVLKTKRIGTRGIVIKEAERVADIKVSDIIVVGAARSSHISEISRIFTNKTVIISCKPGYCYSGASICFTDNNGKLSFEISEKALNAQGLIVSSKLLTLGIKK